MDKDMSTSNGKSRGAWQDSEHERFLFAVRTYGKNWELIANYVRTRDVFQCRNRATNIMIFIKNDPNLKYADVARILLQGTNRSGSIQ